MDDGTKKAQEQFSDLIRNKVTAVRDATVKTPPSPLLSSSKPQHTVLDHSSTPNLAHLEVHYSRLPRKGRKVTKTPHMHDDEELIMIVAGQAQFHARPALSEVNGNASRGTLAYFPPRAHHSLQAVSKDPLDYLCIRFTSHSTAQLLLAPRHRKNHSNAPAADNDVDLPPAIFTFISSPRLLVPSLAAHATREVLLRRSTLGLKLLDVHWTRMAPGEEKQLHVDKTHDVLIIVLEGTVLHLPQRAEAGPFSVALLPAGTQHGIKNIGGTPSLHYAIEFHEQPLVKTRISATVP